MSRKIVNFSKLNGIHVSVCLYRTGNVSSSLTFSGVKYFFFLLNLSEWENVSIQIEHDAQSNAIEYNLYGSGSK